MDLSFNKFHGIGNDFLVLETSSPSEISLDQAMGLCDRHFGVGADGVLLVSAPKSPGARATMTVINADGSRPEMCGNGLRCVALHLCRESDESDALFVVDTDAGPRKCTVHRTGDLALVGTDIGQGQFFETLTHTLWGESFEFQRISTGNPHAVCFRSAPLDAKSLDVLGPEISALIVGGANVEIATILAPTEVQISVWERGVGQTLACGTGAAATVIAAARAGLCPYETPVRAKLPGGSLEITVSKDHIAHLRGPAQWVYRGATRI